jgi:hypothetical protein
MAVFTRTFELFFNAGIIADEIEDFNDEDEDCYEHDTNLVPIIDFANEIEVDDCYSDFVLTKEEEDVIIKEVTEELRKRGWK